MNIFKTIASKIGMDKSLAYSSGANILRAFTGLVSIYFISLCLTGDEQGYWFDFCHSSVLELGFTGIITQYVAHE